MDSVELSSLNFRKLRQMTDSAHVLSRVRLSLERCWGIFGDASLLPFEGKKDELSIHYGCILRGTRVIIHAKGRELVMDMLHKDAEHCQGVIMSGGQKSMNNSWKE